ncbi:MAG: WD40/YVTN/BNR-like repeat-containing protein [Fimbriimonas sp.]
MIFNFRLIPLAGLVGTMAAPCFAGVRDDTDRILVLRLDPVAVSQKVSVGRELAEASKLDVKSGTIQLTLKKGVSLDAAVAKLSRRREVSEIRSNGKVLFSTQENFTSTKAITRRIEMIEEANGGEEKHEGPRKFEIEDELSSPGTDYLRGLREYVRVRAYPYDRMDASAYDRGMDQAKRLKAAQIGPKAAVSAMAPGIAGKWKYVGPNNLNTPYRTYFGVRPSAGRVSAIAYHPTNPSTIYVGAPRGGVLKTTDGGANWTALGDSWGFTAVSSLAVDPKNGNTIYAGTGDFHGMLDAYTMGVMKSTDGGTTWTNLGRAQFGGSAVSAIVVDPEDSNVILVSTGRGPDNGGRVWRSANGGQTWTAVITTVSHWSSLSYGIKDASGKRSLYAIGSSGNFMRSDDRGVTWTRISDGSLNPDGFRLPCVATSAVDAKTLYVLSTSNTKIYKSTDSGATFTDITGSHPGDYNWSQGYYDWYLGVAKNGSSDRIVTGLIDVVESPDSGATWRSIGVSYTDQAKTHNDQHSFAVNPTNPNELLLGNDGGLYRATLSGNTWTVTGLNEKLGITQFYNVVWHPTNKNRILGGTQDNASPVSIGDLNRWENVGGGDGGFNAINWANPDTQFVTVYNFAVIMTKNNWTTSVDISPNIGTDAAPFVTPIYQDPVNSRYLYGCTNYLWRYDITAGTWTARLGGTQLSNGSLIYAVAVAPSNGQVIYTGSDDGRIYVSRNGGTSWRNINTASLPNRSIRSISVNPANPNDILVGLSGTGSQHIFQCADTNATAPVYVAKGGSGASGLPDVPLNVIERDPFKPATNWYIGNDLGVFATGDGGATWSNASSPLGLPNTQVNSLNANAKTGVLNAGTFGRGIWSISLGAEVPTGPSSYSIMTGSLAGGSLPSLSADDGSNLIVTSTKVPNMGQVAAAIATFTVPGTGPLLNLSFDVSTSNSTLNATHQFYVKNWRTGAYEILKSAPATTGRTTITVLAPSKLTDYISGSRKVELVVRSLVPTRYGNATHRLSIDRTSINASAN